ncbi:SDR family NAD(P)-dependent oxidoreductase [Marinococcus luteus]|uniref:SDR family NAD(P)-dependent oxidoreductase n=1 Tax=Marinococcus luteus TaxID=1122204 RepID=UPI002ACCE453|nr:SDR family NAD(P)-dependent oxidoreductase [Marinococcus luteus]MDZ5781712.1 SDR family NAD(P)-dependent oxidoreductase [Marinococcus luteus]
MKTIILTGASSGIGRRTAEKLVQNGEKVIGIGRNTKQLQAAEEEWKGYAGKFAAWTMDVGVTENAAKEMKKITGIYGSPDVLINNAGTGKFGELEQLCIEDWEQMIDTNVKGNIAITQALLPELKQTGGHIVFTGSTAGIIGTPKATVYAASKRAVLGFAEALRLETAGTGVRVSVLNTGPVKTDFHDRADPSGKYKRSVEQIALSPEKVAGQLVKLVERPKRTVFMPRWMKVLSTLYQLWPSAVEKIGRRQFHRK